METIKKENHPPVIFLIGAGASISLGIPAMKGIYKSFMNKSKSGISEEDKKTCKMLTEDLEINKDLEDFLLASNLILQFKNNSLNKLVEKSIANRGASRKLDDYKRKLNKHIAAIESVRKNILSHMSKICFKFDRVKSCNLYTEFIKALIKKDYPIFTTNYDFVFDHVAKENNLNINDNFIQKGQRNIWNSNIDFDKSNALTLINLHGSVTWYSNNNSEIEKILYETPLNQLGEEINRLVVFPTRFKDIYDQHFFALYSLFLSLLKFAKVLIVVGHSLRDEYLRAGIIERLRKNNFKLIVIDPYFPPSLSNELSPNNKTITNNILHIPFKSEDFIDELTSIILTYENDRIFSISSEIVHHIKVKTNKIKIKGKIGILKPQDKKKFEVKIDTYLTPDIKPANIRIWFSAEYTSTENRLVKLLSESFLEESEIIIGDKLTGMVDKLVNINFVVPEYKDWFEHKEKIKLNVAIIKKNIKKPNLITDNSIIAIDTRELTYRY